jgi:hypothetical protein
MLTAVINLTYLMHMQAKALRFSFIGFVKQDVAIAGKSEIMLALNLKAPALTRLLL